MEDLGLKIEVKGLWIEDRQSRFEDSIYYTCFSLSFVANHAILRTL